MTKIDFIKYQGTGNDFIMIDGLSTLVDPLLFSPAVVKSLCTRHMGVGADGLIILLPSRTDDYEMVYYNSDGNVASMCGNGGRCSLHLAASLGYVNGRASFIAVDGLHEGTIEGNMVSLKMQDVHDVIRISDEAFFVDTGSPHYVSLMETDIALMDLITEARAIRYSEQYAEEGTNVNFINVKSDKLIARTYERGVEAETLSCGTGAVAVALASRSANLIASDEIAISTLGGELTVSYEVAVDGGYTNIWLSGPVSEVYRGSVVIS